MPVKNYIIYTWEDESGRIDATRLLGCINRKMQRFNIDRIGLVSERELVFARDNSSVPMNVFLDRHYRHVSRADSDPLDEMVEQYAEQASAERKLFLLVHVENGTGSANASTYIMLFHHYAFDGIGVRLFLRAVEKDYRSESFPPGRGEARGEFTPLSWFRLLRKYANEDAETEQAFWESRPWDVAEDLSNKHESRSRNAAPRPGMLAAHRSVAVAGANSSRKISGLSEAIVYRSICKLFDVEQTVFNTYVSCRTPLLEQNRQVLAPYNLFEAVPVFAGPARRPVVEIADRIERLRSGYRNQGIGFRCLKYLGRASRKVSEARVPLIAINARTYVGDLRHHFLDLKEVPVSRFSCGNYSVLVNASLDFTANGIGITLSSDGALIEKDQLVETMNRVSAEIAALAE